MLQRGKEEIRTYRALLASDQQGIPAASRVQLTHIEFPLYDAEASMSWYLTPHDLDRLDAAVLSLAPRLAALEVACVDGFALP